MPDEAPSQQDVERALAVADTMRQQLALLEEQRSLFAQSLDELRRATRAITALHAAKPGDVLLMPLGAGTYARASLLAPDRVLANVGSGVHVEGGAEDALKLLAERAQATEAAIQRVGQEADRVAGELEELARGLQGLTGG